MNTHARLLSRRGFLKLIGGTALGAGGLFGYSRALEPNWVAVEQIRLPVPRLADNLTSVRIAQVSDIHISDYNPISKFISAVETINSLNPHFVVLTGDYVSRQSNFATALIEPLRALNAPVYAIYGNHDLWTDRETVGRALEEGGARLLLNESEEVMPGLHFAGVDDVWSGRPDLSAALHDIPGTATTLLLVHEPDFFDRVLARKAPVAVQLSGHSHGGQVRLPTLPEYADAPGLMSRAPVLPQHGRRYPIGLRQIESRIVYTNRGLGVWPYPIRLNCRPEITLFTLGRSD